ncbi:PQQ-dependent sugar dehydrogenase [Paenibacillus ehimensis]|uniref:PQQ-dependent sugar dehydrogenase n=1 Tax=Paenibacillus ehimensis TaxID=79264 RepID=A0ABT8V7M8_9BACL|nr:PQQ-dependent sugar dehydrogenase [Paenibacillus ehimensis]MDO3677455.1 PQQ-dependent sugar dehydrogenase [Paenibacillus ehimensis]
MNRTISRTAAGLLLALLLAGCEEERQAAPATGTAPSAPSAGTASKAGFPYKQEIVATGLAVPWEIDFAPDGRIFFTERGGALRVIDKGKLIEKPVFQFNGSLYKQGEAGLLGFTLDPQFERNGYIYAYYTYFKDDQPFNRVVRLKEQGGKAALDKVLLDHLPGNRIHDGGRVKFGPDGMLYITNGDADDRPSAQDVTALSGKIFRIAKDGSVPPDNPFPGSPVYSLGHRNPQGLAWHPETKRLYSSEHGQTAHDEINLIEAGANYGWPLVEGDETELKPADAGKKGPGPLRAPVVHSRDVTWAPSGMTFVSRGPWKDHLLVANLRGTQVLHIVLSQDGRSAHSVEPLLAGELGRLRTVAEAPDGSLYVLTNNRDGRGQPQKDDDKIIRLIPD